MQFMKSNQWNKRFNEWNELCYRNIVILSLLLGSIAFIVLYGVDIINPMNEGWLLNSGDLSQHYLGWKAFRQAKWQFPIGNMNLLTYPSDVSIIYTDSIPLMAIVCKCISLILPDMFQYLGIWGLISFSLQAFFSGIILNKYSKNCFQIFCGELFFVYAPILIFRMFYHTALASNWLILMALISVIYYEDYFKNTKKSAMYWAFIGILVASIHAYYLVMCGIVLAGFMLKDLVKTRRIRFVFLALTGLGYLVGFFIVTWILGGFSSGITYSRGDNWSCSFNLNGLFNSQGRSIILEALPLSDGQYEGFAYLGLGMIVMLITSLFIITFKLIKKKNYFTYFVQILPYFVMGCISVLAALSPKAELGNYTIYDVDLPDILAEAWGVVASTGRLIWVAVYILMILAIISFMKWVPKYLATVLLLGCLLLQIYDTQVLLKQKSDFGKAVIWKEGTESFLKSDIWNQIEDIEDIQHIYITFWPNKEENFAFANYAIKNDMTINRFYLARDMGNEVNIALEEALGKPIADNIFVFHEENKDLLDDYNLNYFMTEEGYIIGYCDSLN